MAKSLIADFMSELKKDDKEGLIYTVKELKENQYGLPLQHYAQQYLFGSTGLRLKVFHSISGVPASCKSPLLMDLMGHVCEDAETGGLGGMGFLYELEDKISPTLLASVMKQHGDIIGNSFRVVKDMTIEDAFKHVFMGLLPKYKKMCKECDTPLIVGFDSIGGAAAKDTVKKIETEGVAGKGYYDKAHFIKYICENAGKLMGDVPIVVMCINQEKEQAASTPYGPPQKKITGGVSQIFKDGHMISANFKALASGDGKVITLRTTKTSFCDARKIEVMFRWNKFGTSQDDAYGHHFDWALASAKCLADPDKGVGELRDICDVKVSDKNLVTCPQLALKSVEPDEFEAALFDPANAELLNSLYTYQKIEKLKDVTDYAEMLRKKRKGEPLEEEPAEDKPAVIKTRKRKPIARPLSEANGEVAASSLSAVSNDADSSDEASAEI